MKKEDSNKFDFLLNAKIEDGLNQIAKYLENANLTVTPSPQELVVCSTNSPQFKLRYFEEEVYLRRREINKKEKKITQEIKKYPAKIEVCFDNLEEVLIEYLTMQWIEETLLKHFDGIIFLRWNQEVIE